MNKKIKLWETTDVTSRITNHLKQVTDELKGIKRGTWFIKSGQNPSYYQFISYSKDDITLLRKGHDIIVTIFDFVTNFKLASEAQVKQHEEYLMKNAHQIAEFNRNFDNNHALKNSICTYLGVSRLPKKLDINSPSFKKLKEIGLDYFYEIKIYSIDFIPMHADTIPNPTKVTSDFDPKNCEFYMVTCRGNYGAKVRHTDYEEALSEAQRIATRENHPCWVVGVVTKVNP